MSASLAPIGSGPASPSTTAPQENGRDSPAAPRRPELLLLLGGFGAILVLYTVLVPFGEHPDEPSHMAYVDWIAYTAQVPDAHNPREQGDAEAHQPPLYYAVAGAVWRLIAPPPDAVPGIRTATLLASNSAFGAPGQQNRFLHTPAERWPPSGWALRLLALRLALLPIPVAVVGVTYAVATTMRPGSRRLPQSAAAIAAGLPQLAFLGSGITNDVLVIVWAGVALFIVLRLVRERELRLLPCLALGAVFGLGVLTKESMLTTAPAIALGVIFSARRPVDLVRGVLAAGAPMLVLLGPYVARNLLLYGSPLSSAAQMLTVPYLVHSPRSVLDPYFLQTASVFGNSLVAYFGWLSVRFEDRTRHIYEAYLAFGALGLIGLAVYLARWRRAPRREVLAVAVLVLTVLGALAGYVYQNLTIDSAQGRHVLVALPAGATLLALGFAALGNQLRLTTRRQAQIVRAFLVFAPLSSAAVGLALLHRSYGHILF